MFAALVLIVTATACSNDEADREHCGVGASCSTTAVIDTTTSATSQPTDTTSTATSFSRTVSVQGLTFTIPAELRFRTDGFASTGEAVSGFYANIPLGPACSPGCGFSSFNPLPAGGVVVSLGVLSGFGAGGPDPAAPAPNISIAGRAAVFSADKPGTCGGDETINVRIPNPSGNEYIVRACLRGPDLTAAEKTIQSVLASALPSGP